MKSHLIYRHFLFMYRHIFFHLFMHYLSPLGPVLALVNLSISQLSVGGIHRTRVTRLWQGFTEIQLIMHSCGFSYRKCPSSSVYRQTFSPEPFLIGFSQFNLLCVTLEVAWSGKKTREVVFGKNENISYVNSATAQGKQLFFYPFTHRGKAPHRP